MLVAMIRLMRALGWITSLALALVVAAVSGAESVGSASARLACTPSWRLFAHKGLPQLLAVDAVGPADVWAAGAWAYNANTSADDLPVVVRWNGTKIAIQTLPWRGGYFSGIAARSAYDVWAVGKTVAGPLAAHFDGHTWQRVGLPFVKGARLADVVAIARDDAWAVGTATSGIMMHWDGRRWQLVDLRGAAPRSELVSIDARSANDVWAFGYTGPWSGDYGFGPVVLHWDGARWTSVQTGIGASEFKDWAYGDLNIAPSGEVWVGVGEQSDAGGAPPRFVRWSGPTHKVKSSYTMPAWDGPNVVGIAAVSSDEVWAAGWTPAISHLNAKTGSWRRPHLPVANLAAISAVSPTDVWAVADQLILRYHC